MLLYYASTYPNDILRYFSSQIILHIDSNAAYLVMIEALRW